MSLTSKIGVERRSQMQLVVCYLSRHNRQSLRQVKVSNWLATIRHILGVGAKEAQLVFKSCLQLGFFALEQRGAAYIFKSPIKQPISRRISYVTFD